MIYDVDLSDKEMLRILEERRAAGVKLKIIGHVARGKQLNVRTLRRMRLHTRVIIRDCKQAFLGSQSLRKPELDARREIGIIVSSPKIVSSLITVFEDDWKASIPAKARTKKERMNERADRAAKKVASVVEKKMVPAPVVKRVIQAIRRDAKVEVDSADAAQMVRNVLKKTVKKATERIVQEAVAK